MNFLKTLFWVVLAVIAVIFAMRNWTPVTIGLWGGLLVDTKLPVLLFVAFLIGLLPTFVWHRAIRWRLKRRLDNAERSLADVRGIDAAGDPAGMPLPIPPTPPGTLL